MVLGSLDYMSPEQRAGERVTAAADQYAFGVMAFEVFTGQLPFSGTLAEVIRGHMETPAPSMRAVVPELPPAVDALIARTLAKDPAHRWPSLVEARERLELLATGGSFEEDPLAHVAAPSGSGTMPRVLIMLGAVVVLLVTAALLASR